MNSTAVKKNDITSHFDLCFKRLTAKRSTTPSDRRLKVVIKGSILLFYIIRDDGTTEDISWVVCTNSRNKLKNHAPHNFLVGRKLAI